MNPQAIWPFKFLSERRTDIDPRRRFVAEGDSWFSLGALKVTKRPNLLSALEFDRQALVVSCANPGDTIDAMAARRKQDPYFESLVGARGGEWWAGILLSGGGNDLIDRLQVGPTDRRGAAVDPSKRLLLTPQEAGSGKSASKYISKDGWAALATGLRDSFLTLDRMRRSGLSRSSPMMAHTYHTPTVRPAGALPGQDGWLYPALTLYNIPSTQWQALTEHLFGLLRKTLLSFDHDHGTSAGRIDNLHVFDSTSVAGVVPAQPDSKGESGDWINEIHLNSAGYQKLGVEMGPWIEGLLRRYG